MGKSHHVLWRHMLRYDRHFFWQRDSVHWRFYTSKQPTAPLRSTLNSAALCAVLSAQATPLVLECWDSRKDETMRLASLRYRRKTRAQIIC